MPEMEQIKEKIEPVAKKYNLTYIGIWFLCKKEADIVTTGSIKGSLLEDVDF